METKDLTKKVLAIIKDKGLKPKPKFRFLLKDYAIWGFFAIAIMVGSLAVSVIIFMIHNEAWIGRIRAVGLARGIFLVIPYFWAVILLIFLFLAYYNFKHTSKGYRYNPYLILVISVIISIILGFGIYFLRGGERLESAFYHQVPIYQKMMEHRGKMFLSPQEGRLAGVIVSDIQDNTFQLKDFAGQVWTITLSDENLLLAPGVDFNFLVSQKARVRIVGEQLAANEFQAEKIMPFSGPRHLQGRKSLFERK